MKPMLHLCSMCFLIVLSLSVLGLVSGACGQAPEMKDIPRDTLIAAARDMMVKAKYCALITLDESGHPRARTMDTFPPDDNMVVWMGTSRITRKVKEIRNDPRVTLYYPDPDHAGYVLVYGTAKLVDDEKEKDKRWKEEYAVHFPEGKGGFILIAVTPQRIEVSDYSRGITGDSKTWQPPSITF